MLNGIAPILIFEFSKIVTATVDAQGNPIVNTNKTKVPVVSSILSKLPLPYIPIYLDEQLTGICIDTEETNIDVETETETFTISDKPEQNQRGINNSVKVTMTASRDSIGLLLLSAMGDLIFPKVTSREYAITYMHGAVIVLSGLLKSFGITQNTANDLYNVTMEIIRPGIKVKQPIPELENKPGVSLISGKVPA